jgi:hypothetical protein
MSETAWAPRDSHLGAVIGTGRAHSVSRLRCVRAYALVELGDSEAIDLFLRDEDAEAELAEIVEDEPDWKDVLRVGADRA